MQDYNRCELNSLLGNLNQAQHRQLFILCGDVSWCIEKINFLFYDGSKTSLVLSKNVQFHSAVWPEHLHQILGQEFDLAVYDGFSGIEPNKLAALSGTVKAGGLLCLVLPELCELEHWIDPAIDKWCSHNYTAEHSPFIKRWQRLLSPGFSSIYSQKHGVNLLTPSNQNRQDDDRFLEQVQLIDTVSSLLTKPANDPILISADRGRGKSSALGLVAAKNPHLNFVICAHQFSAVRTSFNHLAKALNIPYSGHENTLGNLHFIAPDQLLKSSTSNSILLIDEAASLPVPLLIAFTARSEQCIFSSTLVGYEGNGRGYTLKFIRFLEKFFPNYSHLSLHQPIRYADNDPLERQINTLFALDCQYTELTVVHDPRFSCISSVHLIKSESLLQQVFSLLVIAHYQTSVNDLRQLLDSPSNKLFIATEDNTVIGVCLVGLEGGLDDLISDAILKGERRPKGHLLAQQISLSCAQKQFLSYQCARIVRIAIAPSLQKKKIGSQLLQYVEKNLTPQVNYFGSSFGGNAPLLNFWQKHDYRAVKMGFKKDKASAEYTIFVVKNALNTEPAMADLHTYFFSNLRYQLLNQYAQLPVDLVLKLLCQIPIKELNHHNHTQLEFIAQQSANLEQHNGFIWQLIHENPSLLNALTTEQQQLTVRYYLQGHTKKDIFNELEIKSKQHFNHVMNDIIKSFLSSSRIE